MADYQFAQKRADLSWHTIDFHTRGLDMWETICGRPVGDPVVEVLPWNGKSCESCLRITRRREEQEAQRAKPNTDEDTEAEQPE